MKYKKYIFIPVLVIVCIILYGVFAKSTIETRKWVLSYAQQTEAPLFVVAHNENYDFSNTETPLFVSSKPIKLTLEAKNGKLFLTDITNDKTYEGTYKIKTRGRYTKQSYDVVIDGVEGTANFSSKFGRTFYILIGDYCLYFDVE